MQRALYIFIQLGDCVVGNSIIYKAAEVRGDAIVFGLASKISENIE